MVTTGSAFIADAAPARQSVDFEHAPIGYHVGEGHRRASSLDKNQLAKSPELEPLRISPVRRTRRLLNCFLVFSPWVAKPLRELAPFYRENWPPNSMRAVKLLY